MLYFVFIRLKNFTKRFWFGYIPIGQDFDFSSILLALPRLFEMLIVTLKTNFAKIAVIHHSKLKY